MQWSASTASIISHSHLQPTKKFKTQASVGKVILTIFWDVNGPILVHFQEKGQTVSSAQSSDMLQNEMKPAIRSKCRGLLSKRVSLLHNNASPHMVAHTVDTLRALKFELLKRPPYSPNLAPSDFHLFGPMKEHLPGQKFAYDEVMEAVQSWLTLWRRNYFF